MEWEAPAVILDLRPHGEGNALASVLTETEGRYRGLAHGATSRRRAATWQQGNLVQARWVARLAEQLGSLTGELVHPAAALAMDDPLALAVLRAACSVADGALPEREPHPRLFGGLVRLIAGLADPERAVPEFVRWEVMLLGELGYGLDLARCAVTGAAAGLAYVSPRTGCAVADAAAGIWRERLLPLPSFLVGANLSEPADWRDGLLLTGHFLARDAFGQQHRPLPAARIALLERVSSLSVVNRAASAEESG